MWCTTFLSLERVGPGIGHHRTQQLHAFFLGRHNIARSDAILADEDRVHPAIGRIAKITVRLGAELVVPPAGGNLLALVGTQLPCAQEFAGVLSNVASCVLGRSVQSSGCKPRADGVSVVDRWIDPPRRGRHRRIKVERGREIDACIARRSGFWASNLRQRGARLSHLLGRMLDQAMRGLATQPRAQACGGRIGKQHAGSGRCSRASALHRRPDPRPEPVPRARRRTPGRTATAERSTPRESLEDRSRHCPDAHPPRRRRVFRPPRDERRSWR